MTNPELEKRFMTPAQVSEAAAILAAEFGIPEPSIQYGPRTRNGRYSPSSTTIKVGAIAWRGVEVSFLHEFAHHLNTCRGGGNHDKGFWNALLEITRAWYGDPVRYPWGTEYKAGQNFAERRGIRRHR